MKLKFVSSIAAVAVFFLSACSSEDGNFSSDQNAPEIRITSNVTNTRSTSASYQGIQIAKGQQVGVFISENSVSPKTVYDKNLAYSADGLGSLIGITQYFPSTTVGVKISAYHPYNNATDDSYVFTVSNDQTSVEDINNSDLLFCQESEQEPTSNPILLKFKHKLTRVTYNLVAGDGNPDLTDAQVSIVDALSGIEFNRITGELGVSSNTQNIKMNNEFGAILVPQVIKAGNKFLKVTLNTGKELYYIPKTDYSLDSGKALVLNLKIDDKSAASIGSEIEDWESSTVNGTAEEPVTEKKLLPSLIETRVPGLHAKFMFTYDNNNVLTVLEVTEFTKPSGPGDNESKPTINVFYKYTLKYDENKNLVGMITTNSKGKEIEDITFDHSTPGKIFEKITDGKTNFEFVIDGNGRVKEEYPIDGSTSNRKVGIIYTHDDKGNTITQINSAGYTPSEYEYDYTKHSILKNLNVPAWFATYMFPYTRYISAQGPNDIKLVKSRVDSETGELKDCPYKTNYNSDNYPTWKMFQIKIKDASTGEYIITDYETSIIYQDAK